MSLNSLRCSCGLALEDRLGQAYNEEAFRYLLTVERRRAERAGRSLVILLVKVKKQDGKARIPPGVARRILSGLWVCVREIDFVGWFREERVAGAILVQGASPLPRDASRQIGQRVAKTLCGRVPPDIGCRLQVRVLRILPSQGR